MTRRGLAAAAAVLLLMAGGVGWWLWPAAPAYASKPSIAVLPFDNLGGDEATTRLADGITEDIITDLARFPEFEVVSRNSTGIYKGKAVDVRQVGKDLGVGYVLEGSFQRQGERLRATVQLIDAKTGTHLWSNRWDRPVEEVFALQTDLAEQVANRLGSGAGLIQEAGRKAAKRKRPENLGAYELYLLGTERLEQATKDSNDDAVRLLRQAVTLDPTLARAWIELSWAYLGTVGFGADEATGRRAARDAAERAVALDPSDAEAHAAMGDAFGQAGDFVRAEAEYEESLRLNPGSAEILTFYAGWASSFGKPERGAEAADRAIRLNPHSPAMAREPIQLCLLQCGAIRGCLAHDRAADAGPVEPRLFGAAGCGVRRARTDGRGESRRRRDAQALPRHHDPELCQHAGLERGRAPAPHRDDAQGRLSRLRPARDAGEAGQARQPSRMPAAKSRELARGASRPR